MDALFIEGKLTSPTINFKSDGSPLLISGRSIPEHPVKFYQPVEEWILSYLSTNPSKIELIIHLDYLNTHSTECVLIILKKIEAYYSNHKNDIKVVWNVDEDDEDMFDLGGDIKSIVNLPFEIIEVSAN